MLPAEARLRRSAEFTNVLRHGRRAGRPALVVTVLSGGFSSVSGAAQTGPTRVGFVVGRRIGGAVVRNRLRRRLRHLLAERVPRLPAGSHTVVRALPGAERLSYADLAGQLDAVLARTSR